MIFTKLTFGVSVQSFCAWGFRNVDFFSQVCAELKQAQAKLSQAEQSGSGQAAETERLQHKLRELELELARSGQSRNTNASLQEELQAERVRVISADKKVPQFSLNTEPT